MSGRDLDSPRVAPLHGAAHPCGEASPSGEAPPCDEARAASPAPPAALATSRPRELLRQRALHPKRSFGQNFLCDAGIAREIAVLATTPAGGTVVELGAGLGALTAELAARAARTVAVERDRDLVPVLREELSELIASGRLELLEADAKQVDYAALFAGAAPPRVLAGNLPYGLTGPLLRLACALAPSLERVVFMVQLEVADRLVAAPGTAAYGAPSVFVQAAFTAERARRVRRGAFFPQPDVDSAVVVLTPRETPVSRETPTFVALVQAAFLQRRKQLRNAWSRLPGHPEAAVAAAAHAANVELTRRGEELSVNDFAAVARALEASESRASGS